MIDVLLPAAVAITTSPTESISFGEKVSFSLANSALGSPTQVIDRVPEYTNWFSDFSLFPEKTALFLFTLVAYLHL